MKFIPSVKVDLNTAHLAKHQGKFRIHVTLAMIVGVVSGVAGMVLHLEWCNHVSLYANTYAGIAAVWA